MKNLLLLLAFVLLISGCKKECDTFHTGKKCEVEVREQYYGKYYGQTTYQQSGYPGTTSNVFIEVGFHSDGSEWIDFGNFKGKLKDANTFDIPLQQVYNGGTAFTAEGQGSFQGDHLLLIFTLTNSGTTITSSFAGSK